MVACMIVLGLTGSIAMGKSTVTAQFEALGAHTINADHIVHALMAMGGKAVSAVSAAFPGVEVDGAIDRKALGATVFGQAEKLKQLEQILHPLVRAEEEAFVARARAEGAKLVVLDIPLLFETGADAWVHKTVVVTAPAWIQRKRALARPNMSRERLNIILSCQMADAEKRKRADFIVNTGFGLAYSRWQVKRIMKNLGIA